MDKNEDSHFQKINGLYKEYCDLLSKDNVENALQKKKDEIVVEICKVFYLNDKGLTWNENENEEIRKKHEKKIENQKYSCEIFMKALECLKTFSKKKMNLSEKKKTDNTDDFSSYVISSVNARLKYLKAQDEVENKNSGVKISRETKLLVRRIKNEDMQLSRLGIKSKEKREAKLKRDFNLSDDEFNQLLPLINGEAVSLDTEISDGDESTTLGDFQKSIFPSTDELFENREQLSLVLDKIQAEWEKSNDSDGIMSDILTVFVLGTMFGSGAVDAETKRNNVKYDNQDILESYGFMNRKVLHDFFSDSSYKLDTWEEIGKKHGGMTKGGVSKKLSKFCEKLK